MSAMRPNDIARQRFANFGANRPLYAEATKDLDELEHNAFDKKFIGAIMAMLTPRKFGKIMRIVTNTNKEKV